MTFDQHADYEARTRRIDAIASVLEAASYWNWDGSDTVGAMDGLLVAAAIEATRVEEGDDEEFDDIAGVADAE